jgi:polysaccharide export outer membrane protein
MGGATESTTRQGNRLSFATGSYGQSLQNMQFALPLRARSFLFTVLAIAIAASSAAAQTPSPEQLEIFRNLTPEQQRALLEQLSETARQADPPSMSRQSSSSVLGAEVPDADMSRRRQVDPESGPVPDVPVIKPEDTVLVEVRLSGDEEGAQLRQQEVRRLSLDPAGRARLERLVEQIRLRNPYQLDRNAQLNLPGLAPIGLSGLTERQATQRLALEPTLMGLDVRLLLLPLERTGVAGLKPFGYDLFDATPSTFAPVTNVPVPADYVVGPEDELAIQLFGSQNRNLRLTVTRDGVVNFPELGPIRVGGMTFNAARQVIETRVSQQMIGVQASVTMGEVRTIRVLVTGEAKRPGYYTVSGLATMTTALYASGGIKPIGSLRDIQLKRQGEVIRRLDLYDLLIHGDTSDDARLLPGDAIFIPPVGSTVAVEGEVKRPAIYELRDETKVGEVVRIAGGLTAEADPTRISLTQIGQDGRRVVLDVNLARAEGASLQVGDGAVLRVARLRPQIDEGVELVGEVYRPGPVAWRPGLRLTDVIGSVDELRPGADQHYILIRREIGPNRRVSALSADLAAALAAPGSEADLLLAPRDQIRVFDLSTPRERIIRPLLEEMQLQSDLARPTEVVSVRGKAKVPGEYPLEAGMRVSDLLRAGGNLDASAYGASAELTRYTVGPDGTRQAELIEIDLAAVLRGDASANILLQPFDSLMIKETPDWTSQESVTLRGEVRFPGTYSIRRGETLRQVLERAGGLTPLAFPEGSVFMRRDLRDLEQQQLDRLAERLRADVAMLALQAANAGQSAATDALQSGQTLLAQLQSTQATGRFIIDLPGLLSSKPGSAKDVLLRDGDELVIPKKRQEVSVIGEVQNVTSHLYQPNLTREDYINLSGGTTRKADKARIYVVRADGSVANRPGSRLKRSHDVAIRPGDTIVVPINTERMPRLPFWQAVTQILYNVAVSVAAVNSF